MSLVTTVVLATVLVGLALVAIAVAARGARDTAPDTTPDEAAGERDRALPERPAPTGRFVMERLRILIVDDEPLVGKMIARLMAGHEITTVTSGEAALAALAADDRFDVVLCDLVMPEMSGVKLAAEIAERHHHLKSRLIFLAGGAVTLEAKQHLAGPDARWVTKPARYAQLASCIAEVVEAARSVVHRAASAAG